MRESTITPAGCAPAGGGRQRARDALVAALSRPRLEVLPLPGTLHQVEEHVPRDLPVTVTASPRRGLQPTLDLTAALAGAGYATVPHLAARLVADEAQLADILHRLAAVGVQDVFVVGGDGQRPVGAFGDAAGLLQAWRALVRSGRAPAMGRVGIAGYPEGHPLVADADLSAALQAKEPMASYLVSQLCFDSGSVSNWLTGVRRLGVQLPLHVGVAGAVDRRKLLGIVARIGVGPSARFLRKHRFGLVRLAAPGGYRPDRLVGGLGDDLADPTRGMAGLHIYTLGDVAATERWRRRALSRLTRERTGHA